MATLSNVNLSFSQIQAVMGGTVPISLSEYYSGGTYANGVAGVPASGNAIKLSHFQGKSKYIALDFTAASAKMKLLGGGDSFSTVLSPGGTGTIYNAGNMYYGQLGDNYAGGTSRSDRLTVSVVPAIATRGSLGSRANGVSIVALATSRQTPGHTLALDSTGAVHAWGYNTNGQIGSGDVTYCTVPTLIAGASLSGRTVVTVAAGFNHTLAIDSTGALHAWGKNGDGQLGVGATDDKTVPTLVQVAGTSLSGRTVVAVAAGETHTLAIDSTGALHAWGANSSGQLGTGDKTGRTVPTLVQVAGTSLSGRTIVAVAAGEIHTFALDSTGAVHAWGNNGSGQLGTGDVTSRTVPTLLADTSLFGRTVVAVATGCLHTLALDSTGAVHAWGGNSYGQLGTATGNTTAPVLVAVAGTSLFGRTVVAVAAGFNHTLAIDSTGAVHTWGNNSNGQLLDGTITPRSLAGATGVVLV